jgi:hypothetical protein
MASVLKMIALIFVEERSLGLGSGILSKGNAENVNCGFIDSNCAEIGGKFAS